MELVFKTSKPHEKTRGAGPAEVSHFPLHLLLRSPGKEFALAQLAREILPTGFQSGQGEKENRRAQVLVSNFLYMIGLFVRHKHKGKGM